MKKLTALLLSVILCLVAISASAEGPSPTGTWYLSHAVVGNMDCPAVDNEALTLVLNEDGTCVFTINLENCLSREGTWTVTDSTVTMTVQEQSDFAQFEGDKLVIISDQATTHMSRTPEEPIRLPAIAPADSPDAFSGTWILSAMIYSGLYLPGNDAITAIGLSGINTVVIEDGPVMYYPARDDSEEDYTPSFDYSFADGILTAESTVFVPTVKIFTLREDGSLYIKTTETYSNNYVFETTAVYVRETE